jgi:cysteinyl-tRNA synthetase
MLAGARVDVAPYKRGPMDFVLWKPSDNSTPGWDSPWGRGRPGWHIECSAMSEEYLGETFDIHGGGIDLLFPHHENEIAQSESAHHGRPLARVWMHNGFLNVEGEKMSKSLGNFVTIHELQDDYPGGALRFAMLQTHYRQPINWTSDKLFDAWDELTEWTSGIYGSTAQHDMHLRKAQDQALQPDEEVLDALSDDLNTPEAVTILRDLYKRHNDEKSFSKFIETAEFLGLFEADTIGAYNNAVNTKNLAATRKVDMRDFDLRLKIALINRQSRKIESIKHQLLSQHIVADVSYDGFVRFERAPTVEEHTTDDPVQVLIDARNAARKEKDFKEADRIRDELLGKGIVLKDGPSGTTWEVKR